MSLWMASCEKCHFGWQVGKSVKRPVLSDHITNVKKKNYNVIISINVNVKCL